MTDKKGRGGGRKNKMVREQKREIDREGWEGGMKEGKEP